MESAPTADDLLAQAEWVHRLARALVGNDADAADLAQDALSAAISRPPEKAGSLAAWLTGVTRNLARLRWRTDERRRKKHEQAPSAEAVPTPEALVQRAQAHQLVTRLLLELEEPLRSTLLLRYYEGLSSAEIARRLKLPPGTVRWRLKRALDLLRTKLDENSRGERRRWALLFAPFTARPLSAPLPVAHGVLLVKMVNVLVVAVVALLLAWLGWHEYGARNASTAAPIRANAPRKSVESVQLHAMRESSSSADPDPAGQLRLEGQVIDEQDRAVAGAEVALDASPPQRTHSGLDGAFVFEKLIARDYRLEARTSDGHAGPVEMRLSAASDPVTLRIRPGGVLEVEVRAGSGAVIAGASVELRSGLVWQAVTDERGHARLSGIGAGWPTLHVSAAGYAPGAMMLRTSGDPRRAQRQIVSLERGAPVTGRVVDDKGKPLAGARVVAAATSEPFPVLDLTRDGVVSQTDGSWRMEAVAAGSVRFIAFREDFEPGATSPIVLDGAHAQSNIEIRVKPGATVSGRVLDEKSRPVASALVTLVGRGSVPWRMWRQAHTDGDGRFRLRGLPARPVEISASSAEASSELVRLDLTAGGEREISLELSLKGTLDGVVVSPDGRELAEARVLAQPEWSGALGEREAWDARDISSILADGGGRFHFAGLPQGRYRVRAVKAAASDDALFGATAIAANSGDRDLRVVVADEGRVRGKVAFKDGASPEIFSIEIGAVRPEPFSTVDGTFDLEAQGGKQIVVVSGPNFQQTILHDVQIKEDGVTDLGTITVERGRSVSGRVLDADGQPVAAALVAGGLLLTGNGSQLNIASEGFHVQETQSDDTGRYLLRGFHEDPIVVVAERDGVGRSTSIRIPRGSASVEVDLVLQKSGSLSGTVTRNGQPMAETVVIANPRGARSSNFFVMTGADGSYVFDTLSAGEYIISPMFGGGGIKPKDMFFEAVTITTGSGSTVDLAAQDGAASVDVKVTTDRGQPVGVALVFAVGGTVSAPNMETLLEGSWVPSGGQLVPAYLRMATSGAPAHIDGLVPGPYSFCAVPMQVDPNDPVAMRAIRDVANSLPMQCMSVAVGGGGQVVSIRSP